MLDRRRHALAWSLVMLAAGACARAAPGPVSPARGHPLGSDVTSLPLANGPWGAAVSSGGVAYVGWPLTDSIARIDLDSPRVIASFAVGNRPDDIWFNARGSAAYVTNLNDGTIGVVDASSHAQETTFPVAGGHPLRIRLGAGETRLYVTVDDGSLAVLDAATGAELARRRIGSLPNGLAFTPDGTRLYVSATRPGAVTEIVTATNAPGRTLWMGGTPQDLVGSYDGGSLFVANESGWVGVWDLRTWVRADSVSVPGAFGLGLTPDGTQLWVTQPEHGTITILDGATHRVVRRIFTAGTPRHIAFAPDGSAALVANEAGFAQIVR